MARVVLDTNVLISAFLFQGKPRLAVQMAEDRLFELVTSQPLRDEAERILARKFHWTPQTIAEVMNPLWALSEDVQPDFVLTDCPDPDDNRVLECAIAGRANCIVTGDKILLRMHPFRNVAILRVDDFLSLGGHT